MSLRPAFLLFGSTLLLVMLSFGAQRSGLLSTWPYGAFGTCDYLEYFSAYQLWKGGSNPYDSWRMYSLQQELGQGAHKVVMMWNPPWALILLSPVLWLPLQVGNLTWLLSHVVAFFVIVETSAQAAGRSRSPFLWSALAVIFMPLFETVALGQISILLALGISLFLWNAARRRDLAAGLALSVCTVKPHLFIVAAIFLGYWIVSTKRYRVVYGLIAGTTALVALSLVVNPQVITFWLQSFSQPLHPDVVPVQNWKVATVGFLLRSAFATPGIVPPTWPIWGVTLATSMCAAMYLALRRPRANLGPAVLPILALSVVCSPYGWYFDQVVLLPAEAFLLAAVDHNRTRKLLAVILLLSVQLISAVHKAVGNTEQQQFVWVPIALLGIWLLCVPRWKRLQGTGLSPSAAAP